MKSIRNIIKAAVLGVAIIAAAAAPTKKAHADGGAVVAGIAGGLILGTIIGSSANAHDNGYYGHPTYTQPYYAPAPTYYAPQPYYPPVSLSFGYSSGHHYGHRRHYRGHRRHFRGHRGHGRHHYRGHRRHGRHHRRHGRHHRY